MYVYISIYTYMYMPSRSSMCFDDCEAVLGCTSFAVCHLVLGNVCGVDQLVHAFSRPLLRFGSPCLAQWHCGCRCSV
jgi:hypothetical protein